MSHEGIIKTVLRNSRRTSAGQWIPFAFFFLSFLCVVPAFASGPNFNDTTSKAAGTQSPTFTGNIGIGTTTPVNGTSFMNGNVGVGTWSPTEKLQVVGTLRATSFVGDGSGLTGISGGGSIDGLSDAVTDYATDHNMRLGSNTAMTSGAASNLFIGESAGTAGTSNAADENVAIGYRALDALTIGAGNVALGFNALGSNTSGEQNVAVGRGSLAGNSTGISNIAVGYNSMAFNDTGGLNTAVGFDSLRDTNTGGNNTALGYGALKSNQAKNESTAVGYSALFYADSTATGSVSYNTAVGAYAMTGGSTTASDNTGIYNTALGHSALNRIVDGLSNTAVGVNAAANTQGGSDNVAVGRGALYQNGSGGKNVAVGEGSLGNVTASNNIALGFQAGDNITSGGNNIVIGYDIDALSATASSQLNIGNTIYGDVSTGNVGIGTFGLTQKLNVVGTVSATSFIGDGSGLTGISAGGWTDGGTNVYASTTTDTVGIGTTTAPSRLTIAGNVGIGTTTPYRTIAAPANGIIAEGNVGIGTFAAANGKLIVTGGNVGIGSTVPSYSLEVVGNARIKGDVISNADLVSLVDMNIGEIFTVTKSGGVTFDANSNASANSFTIRREGINKVALDTGANILTLFGGSGGGSVGIGTSTPVNGMSIMNGNVGIGTWSAVNRLSILGNIGIGTTLPYRRISAPNNGMTVEGNVGIGTWNPSQKLQVVGTVSATSFVGDGSGLTGISAGGWTDGGTNIFTSATTDTVGIGTTTPNAASFEVVKQSSTVPFKISGSASGSGDYFVVRSDGRVGIGTTSPGDKIEFVDSQNANAYFTFANYTSGGFASAGVQVRSDTASGVFAAVSNSYSLAHLADRIAFGGGLDAAGIDVYAGATTGDIHFLTGGAGSVDNIRMVIDAAGNVGIGTFLSSGGLAVMNGNVGIGTWSSPANRLSILGNIGIGTTLPYRRIAAPNNGMVVEGNVGIGTWNPSAKLQVVGTVNATTFVGDGSGLTGISAGGWTDGGTNVFTSTTTDRVGIGTTTPNSATLEVVKNAAQPPLKISSSATADGDFLTIASDGNIGIGTAVMAQKFQVWGNNADSTMAVGNKSPTGFGGIDFVNDIGQYMVIQTVGSGTIVQSEVKTVSPIPLIIGTTDVERMRIDSGGSVGIGTIPAGSGLAVMNGNVGIGTWSSPANRLSITGNIGIGTTLPYRRISAPNNGMVVEGNVGIGTWNPQAKLQIIGTVNATTFVGDGSGLTGISAGGWSDGGTNVYPTSTADAVGIGTTSPLANGGGSIKTLSVSKHLIFARTDYHMSELGSDSSYVVAEHTNSVDYSAGLNVITAGGDTVGGIHVAMGNAGTNSNAFSLIGMRMAGSAYSTAGGSAVALANGEYLPGIAFAGQSNTSAGTGMVIGAAINGIVGGAVSSGVLPTDITFRTSATDASGLTERLRLTSLGNVGIGTANPINRLSIVGNIGIGTTLPYRRIAAPNNGMVVEGNVGIGTWNPSAKLQVVGTVNATAFVGDGSGLTGISSGGWTDGGTNVYASTTTDTVGIGTTTAPSRLTIAGNVGIGTTLPYRTIAGPNNGIIVEGNVGIGTWSPQYNLDLGGGGSIGGTNLVTINGGGFLSFQGYSSVSNAGFDLYLRSGATGNLLFYPDATERARFSASGNLGIGTVSPVGALTVMNGKVGIGTWSPTQALQVVGTVNATSFVGDGSLLTGIAGGASGWTDGGTNVYTSTTTDNVGIGTTTPMAPLQIGNGTDSSGESSQLFVNYTTTDSSIGVRNSSTDIEGFYRTFGGDSTNLIGILFGALTNHNLSFYTNDTPRMVITNGGNVGIGTLTPFGALTVMSGNVGIGTINPADRLSIAGNIGIGTTRPYLTIAAPNNGMVVEGNVGIGTWNPSQKLQVVGTVSATSFVGDGSGLTGISAGGWTDGGTNVYTSTTTDNVGIGTTTPTNVLHVSRGNPDLRIQNSTFSDLIFSVGSTNASMVANAVSLSFETNGSAGNNTNGTQRMVIDNGGNVGIGTANMVNGVSIMNGNVGIGTWNAINRLSVVGNIGIGTTLPYRRIAGPNNGMLVEGNVGIGTWTANGQLVVMGNMGVNTTAPGVPLDVRGSNTSIVMTLTNTNNSGWSEIEIHDDSGADRGVVGFGNTGTAGYQSGVFFSGTEVSTTDYMLISNGVDRMRLTTGGGIGIGTSLPSPTAGLAIMSGNVGIGTWSSPANRLSILGNIGIGTTLPYRRISAPNDGMVVEGNVGVGTWNPSAKLQVVGTVNATTFVGDGSGLTGISAGGWTDGGVNVFTSTTTDNVGIGTTTPATAKLAVLGGNVGIGTVNPVGAFTVMNGNVGIGTWSPRARLEVKNTLAYSTIFDNGNSGTSLTVNWNNGNIQKVTMTGDCTFTFTAPGGIARLTLQLVQDGTGGRTATWPASVKWPSASAPTLTSSIAAVDFISCLYDGTNYYCTDTLDLR